MIAIVTSAADGGVDGVVKGFFALALIVGAAVGFIWLMILLGPIFQRISPYVMGGGVLTLLTGLFGHWQVVSLTGLGIGVVGFLMFLVGLWMGDE